jgi:hypothetical protein
MELQDRQQSQLAINLTELDPIFISSCQRQWELLPSLGVRRPFTFHILIFSSENPQPNDLHSGHSIDDSYQVLVVTMFANQSG